jgi:hypothetical protein
VKDPTTSPSGDLIPTIRESTQGGAGDRFGIPNPSPKAEARPKGRAVSMERLGDWDGPMEV